MSEPLVYLDGRMLPASQARLAISDAGFVLGATVTEQTRTFRHRPYRLAQHLDRLFRSLHSVQIDPGLTPEQLAAISEEVLAHNARLVDPADDLGLLQFVTPGPYPTYAGTAGRPAPRAPTVGVHTFPLPFELWARRMQAGVHLVTPSVRQVPPQCWGRHLKVRSRLHYYLADQEARRVDPDAVALLLDLEGNVTETGTANLLLVERGAVVSPPADTILAGISRATVIELCGRLGIPFGERPLGVDDVRNADEAFLTSTPYCLMPATRINGVAIGGGRPGPVAQRLLEAWSAAVGMDIVAQIQEGARRREAALKQAPD